MDLKFGKNRKLKSRKSIELLFESGQKTNRFPIGMRYRIRSGEDGGFRAAFSVPKRNFKRAVDRNLLKRRMREALRLHQHKISTDVHADLMLIYLSPKKQDYLTIEKSILQLIVELNASAIPDN